MKKVTQTVDTQAYIRHLEERIAYLEKLLFGSKSEKRPQAHDPNEPDLFADLFKEIEAAKAQEIEQVAQQIQQEAQKRRAQAKKESNRPSRYLYAGLEEVVRVVQPEDIDLECYEKIGQDETRVLHYSPARFWVEVIVRPIYRHKDEKQATRVKMLQAAKPYAVIGGGHIAPDFLAQLVVDKYVHHLPEYRQVKRYKEMGLTLSTSTLNDWIHRLAKRIYPLYEALGQAVRGSDYLQIDEVPWRIADRAGKSRKGYAWEFLDARPDSRGLYFYYLAESRSGSIPRAQLRDFKGAIQTDGYGVYDYFEQCEGITLLGCMAHIRRKFVEAEQSSPELARKVVEKIALIYTFEENLRNSSASPEEIAAQRKEKILLLLQAMKEWMESAKEQTTPSDAFGKALAYAIKLWPRIIRYTLDGRYQLDNNGAERNIRPTVLGRKNYLFSKDDNGAQDNAIFYSLLGSCQVVGVNPLEWLTYALGNLREEMKEEDEQRLLPYQYKKSQS